MIAAGFVSSVHSAAVSGLQATAPATTGFILAGNGAAAPPTTSANASGTVTAAAPASGMGAHGFFAVGAGPDGEGFNPTSKTTLGAIFATGIGAPAAETSAFAGAIGTRRAGKSRQQGRQFRFEYINDDLEGLADRVGTNPRRESPAGPRSAPAPTSGSGPLGYAGTVPKSVAAQAKGLARLGRGEFGEAPQEPMLPGTWKGAKRLSRGPAAA